MSRQRPATLVLTGASADLSLLGGKGASLDQLLGWGLPVPPTGAVTTEGYRHVVADPAIRSVVERVRRGDVVDAAEVDEVFRAGCAASALRDEVGRLAQEVGGPGGRLAVRSSATVEDLAASSFAGQYTSVLDVDADDPDAVMDAVARVFASLWHPSPCAYRQAFGISDDDVAMSAVLMRMVPATRAGVVFTADPGGCPGAARIEVVEGLAESLVSGQRTPEAFVVPRSDPPEDLAGEVRSALDLALEVERRAGRPQDVEWAWDGTTTMVVQARPITVAVDDGDGFDSPPSDDELTTAAIGETLPGVLAPMVWELASHLVDEAFHRVLDDLGVQDAEAPAGPLVRRVRGRAALDFSRIRHMAEALPGDAGEELEQQYFGSRRRGRPAPAPRPPARRLPSPAVVAHDLRVLSTRRRVIGDADAVVHATIGVLAAHVELSEVGDRELAAYRMRVVDLAARGAADELAVAAVAVSSHARLEAMLAPHLGPDGAAAAAERVTSTAGVTVARAAHDSAAVVAGPTWSELGLEPPDGACRMDPSEDPTVAERLDGAVSELAQRLESTPTWGAASLRHHLRVTALHRTVADVVDQLRRRERTKAAVLALGGELRRVHLELGCRLVARGLLAAPTDVDLLSSVELRRALAGAAVPAVVLARRRRWLERYESEGPLPVRFVGEPQRQVARVPEGRRLEGWATSPGSARGTAQVVHGPTERLEPGHVLVAEATDASWAPLFVGAAGIVLERGGPLSHAAILARELGVPAVLNVAGATRRLDGHEIAVDGDAGLVVVLDEDPRGPS
jgi:pyruvate,water dikinase